MTREEQLITHVFKHAKRGDADSVLREIDAFCASNWMMNLGGGDKGAIVRAVVGKAVAEGKVKLAVEFGGYCGYSAVLFGSLLPAGSKFISIEINPVYAALATKIIEFAGLADKVEVVVSDVPAALAAIRERFGEGSLDLTFIDHWCVIHWRAKLIAQLQRATGKCLSPRELLDAPPADLTLLCCFPAGRCCTCRTSRSWNAVSCCMWAPSSLPTMSSRPERLTTSRTCRRRRTMRTNCTMACTWSTAPSAMPSANAS